MKSGRLGFHYGFYWPRQVCGRLVDELAAQGAETIGFDFLLGELRNDPAPAAVANGDAIDSE